MSWIQFVRLSLPLPVLGMLGLVVLFAACGQHVGEIDGADAEQERDSSSDALSPPGNVTAERSTEPELLVAPFGTETANEYQQAWADHLGVSVEITNSVGMKLALIPPGEFMMGNREAAADTAAFFKNTCGTSSPADYFKDEHPRHRVRITKPLFLGTCHVTRGQFRRFVAETGYKTDAEKGDKPGAFGWDFEGKLFRFNEKHSWHNMGFTQTDDHPVVNVSWNDAMTFCKWLSGKEEKTYRLPTEAEWEYACRAGTATRYYNGDDPESLAQIGNVADAAFKTELSYMITIKAADGYVFTAPTGEFRPNAFGLYDMQGNAWQWCADWYGAEYYSTSLAVDPLGPAFGDMRVLRGGSWSDGPHLTRSASRYWLKSGKPGPAYYVAGFRVARID